MTNASDIFAEKVNTSFSVSEFNKALTQLKCDLRYIRPETNYTDKRLAEVMAEWYLSLKNGQNSPPPLNDADKLATYVTCYSGPFLWVALTYVANQNSKSL